MSDYIKIHDRREQLRAATAEELAAAEQSARKRIYQFRKDRLSKPQENVKVIKNSRKEIARILTIKRQRELGIGG